MFAMVIMGHESKKNKRPWFNDQCNSSTEENYKTSLKVIQNSIEENKEYYGASFTKLETRLWYNQ